jgi:hypothetical protein
MILQAEAGRGQRQRQRQEQRQGRAACQLVGTIDMWDFGIGSLRVASACERGPPVCSNCVRRGGAACHTWMYHKPEFFLVSSRPVARIWRRQCWRTDIAVGQREGVEEQEGREVLESKTWPLQLAACTQHGGTES